MNVEISETDLLKNGYKATTIIWVALVIFFAIESGVIYYYIMYETKLFSFATQSEMWLKYILYFIYLLAICYGYYSKKSMLNKKTELHKVDTNNNPAHPAAMIFLKYVFSQYMSFSLGGTCALSIYLLFSDKIALYLLFPVSVIGVFLCYPRETDIKIINEHTNITE
ncbi:MAG: hypothetical protein COA36_15830 [Desulfotalea sp.]|nr:MAG: hypothetical protein COA36_15830 [Desulfotalea sp.]